MKTAPVSVPTAGALYFWASKLGGPAWGWFTGWFNLVGQIAVTAAIQYGWTLWAAIQDGSSPLDFDFWSWGMEKYDRAVAAFDGPDIEQLLVAASQPDQPTITP